MPNEGSTLGTAVVSWNSFNAPNDKISSMVHSLLRNGASEEISIREVANGEGVDCWMSLITDEFSGCMADLASIGFYLAHTHALPSLRFDYVPGEGDGDTAYSWEHGPAGTIISRTAHQLQV